MRDEVLKPDGKFETQSGEHLYYEVQRKDTSGNLRDWICVESNVFREVMGKQIRLEEKDHDSPPIMELKRRDADNKIRSQIAINLEAAIAKRIKRGHKTEYLMEIAEDYGYPDVRSLQNVLNVASPTSLTAEDILYFEKQKGIHRDEILGVTVRKGLSNIRGFQRIYDVIKEDPELRNSVNELLRVIHDTLTGCSGMEAERRCNDITAKIKATSWT
ncbi:hypothetical protein [Paenibacillus sp. MMS20-IR301]|uniref:hypothetical protein n=1 Tax=Paenibacillus sp. MMS20-IR301 TaxID=2895946 RepID=UPI0028ED4AAA|nr:hypothetical protein [Paenibacillus sp. MMS20-IR301]WNS46106.1 hypothetical protein LOS79_12785 [Paenibacillus sp. MMS20-IR301]